MTLAMWADTAAALRGPRKGAKELEYPAARLATSLVAMAIIRLSTDSASPYAFAATGYGGISGRLTMPHDSARRLFAVMRAPPLADAESRVFDSSEVNQKAHLMGVIPTARKSYATRHIGRHIGRATRFDSWCGSPSTG